MEQVYSTEQQNQKPARPDTNLVWAILTTIFCCLPFGIVALIYAAGVDTAYASGNYEEALYKSKQAAKWSIWSAVAAAIGWTLYVIGFATIIGVGGLAGLAAFN